MMTAADSNMNDRRSVQQKDPNPKCMLRARSRSPMKFQDMPSNLVHEQQDMLKIKQLYQSEDFQDSLFIAARSCLLGFRGLGRMGLGLGV